MEIDIHFVQGKVALGELQVHHVPTNMQFADIMTKGLLRVVFEEFKSGFCVLPDAQTRRGTCINPFNVE
jgi:hypothetical protein